MIRRGAIAIFGLLAFGAQADDAITLDQLLEHAQRDSRISQQINAEREQRFLRNKQTQQQLLNEAKQRLRQAEKTSDQLKRAYNENERKLDEQKKRLAERSATLGEVFGAVRQVAGDAGGMIHASQISAQITDRDATLDKLAKSKALPSIEELQAMWTSLLQEMVASGKVVQFDAPVITADGSEAKQTVTRVGSFNSFSEGRYLRYLPESQRLVELSRQPASRFQEMAHELETQSSGQVDIGLDPSRGAILSAIVQTPGYWERIQQGGIIGYVILVAGLIALLLAIERFWFLQRTNRAVQNQLQQDWADTGNPLGRVLSVYSNDKQDVETLQLKLDEAVLKEVPQVERGLSTIAIMAAIAPLLGLLGTVTGMIETFTSITLFGTGDPRYMSSGISQALVTTELGLAVSIPIILLHSFLTSRGNRIIQTLDEQSAGVIARLSEIRNGSGTVAQ